MKLKSLALLLMTIAMPAMAEQVSVNTKSMSLVLDVENGKPAQYLYFGTKLNNSDLQNLKVATDGRMDAYPAYGLNSSKFLMEHGLEMPYTHDVDWGKKNDRSSRVICLEAE